MRKFTQYFDKVYAGYAGLLYAYSLIFFYQYFARRIWAIASSPFVRVNETALNVTYLLVVLLILGIITAGIALFFLWKKRIIGKILTHVMLWLNLIAGVAMGYFVYDTEGRYAKYSWYVFTWRWMFVVLVIFSIIGLMGLFTRWNPKQKPAPTPPQEG